MPGKVKVKIISGRNLPVMDRSSDTTDAYVEIKLGTTTFKTDVCRKSLHPQWNSEWYRFEVDDSELQDEPLQIRLMDHDTYSANDAIGKVYLDLNPLLLPAASLLGNWHEGNTMHDGTSSSTMSGWIPVYDTMHGIRGEVNIIVKVELFSDFNKFRQSSCGVHFFCSPTVPHGFYAQEIHGFVEELVVNDDPEYQWIDKIRTPRASNEARQTLFFKLSGELQRKIGVKALDLGGNAVIGYNQAFDLEGDSGIVARGIGTAVTLVKIIDSSLSEHENISEERSQNYLKFLGCARGFYLKNDSNEFTASLRVIPPSPLAAHSFNLESTVLPIIPIMPLREFIPSDHLLQHSTSLQTVLKQENMRGTPGVGISQKIRNLKHTSQSMLLKRMTALKAKLGNEESIYGNYGGDQKRSLFKYRRTQSDSSGMAEILVRSVFNATSSLESIAEARKPTPANNSSDLASKISSDSGSSIKNTTTTSTSSNSSSDDDEEDDEQDEEEEEAENKLDQLETLSQVVENVRKLSMIQQSSSENNNSEKGRKVLFVMGEDDSELNDDYLIDTLDMEIIPEIETESFLPQITQVYECIKRSNTALSLMDQATNCEKSLSRQTKFTSLHDIHKINHSRINRYSAHHGKETVLGELLKRVEPMSQTSNLDAVGTSQNTADKFRDSIQMLKEAPKHFFHRLDEKLHTKKHETEENNIKNPHGLLETALQNVLMDSVNEMLATQGEKDIKPIFTPEPSPGEKKHPLDFPDAAEASSSVSEIDEKKIEKGHVSLLKRSKCFLKKLDTQLVKKYSSKSPAVSPNGLLETALGNVLMDSVQEVLATSHSESKTKYTSSDPPNFPEAINTEIVTGKNSNNITLHASCLTQPRNEDAVTSDAKITECGHQRTESLGIRISYSPAKLNSIPCIHRRSSDSDLSITPKGNSLTGSDRSGGCSSAQLMRNAMFKTNIAQENFDIMEYPFLTMTKYPPGFITFLGGAVSARSVKLLERITNIEEPESRDTWWSEIRMEIRSHARALNCNAVLGYIESTSICDEVCVLSASGTAAVIGYHTEVVDMTDRSEIDSSKHGQRSEKGPFSSPEREITKPLCGICHLPYVTNSVPLRQSLSKCITCKSGKVPDMLIATIEIPEGIPSIGRGCFLQSCVCRPLRDLKGESNAKEISDGLPFLEYELHRYLISKLKIKGMNAIFGLKVRISVGERMLIGIATGTAIFLSPLPPPPLPKLVPDRTSDEKKLVQLQKSLHDTVKKNREIYQLYVNDECANGKSLSDTDDSEDEPTSLDLSAGNKDCCILEIDDPEDVDVLNSLMEPRPPDGFHVVNTEYVPGLEELEIVKNLQMFKQIWRAKIQPNQHLDKHFQRLLQSVYFKLRRMIPCALCDLQFRVDSPEPDEVQLCVLGMALGLGDPKINSKVKRKNVLHNEDLIFNLEEDQIPEDSVAQTPPTTQFLHTQSLKHRQKSPSRNRLSGRQRHVPYRERHGVDITPLSYVPGGKIEKYLGNLNFFFIRETTSLREEGGLSGFIHSFITEVLAIVRAHVTALGGNAMVAYFITECVLNHNMHKNQGQCLINVGGDVVYVSYFNEDH